jgi:Lytic transglycolase
MWGDAKFAKNRSDLDDPKSDSIRHSSLRAFKCFQSQVGFALLGVLAVNRCLLFSQVSPLKLIVDSAPGPNYPETLEVHPKETAILFRSFHPKIFVFLIFSLVMGLFPGCVAIRQSLNRGTFDAPLGGAGGAPNDDSWKGQMEGVASWYGEEFNGRLTASGEVYDMYALTAAHRTLPLGTIVRVTNQDNGKTVEVKVNDRGPFVKNRVIDLSKSACRALDMMKSGTARVKLDVVRWPEQASR